MHSNTMREATASLTQWLDQHATVDAAKDAGYIGLKIDNPAGEWSDTRMDREAAKYRV